MATCAAAPKLDDAMAYVQKLAARSVAHQLSTAGGAMLAGMDAATARALAAQASGLYCGGWAHVPVCVGICVCRGLEGERVSAHECCFLPHLRAPKDIACCYLCRR